MNGGQRVTVVEDVDGDFEVPRLLLRDRQPSAELGPVSWELFYGGRPIAAGSIEPGHDVLFTEVPSVLATMDGSGLALTGRYADGTAAALEATLVRAARRRTRAEATARAKWSGVRDQQRTPSFRAAVVSETCEVSRGAPPPAPDGRRAVRSVSVYDDVSVLLARLRRHLRSTPARRG